jgi:hypothetical protein
MLSSAIAKVRELREGLLSAIGDDAEPPAPVKLGQKRPLLIADRAALLALHFEGNADIDGRIARRRVEDQDIRSSSDNALGLHPAGLEPVALPTVWDRAEEYPRLAKPKRYGALLEALLVSHGTASAARFDWMSARRLMSFSAASFPQ